MTCCPHIPLTDCSSVTSRTKMVFCFPLKHFYSHTAQFSPSSSLQCPTAGVSKLPLFWLQSIARTAFCVSLPSLRHVLYFRSRFTSSYATYVNNVINNSRHSTRQHFLKHTTVCNTLKTLTSACCSRPSSFPFSPSFIVTSLTLIHY